MRVKRLVRAALETRAISLAGVTGIITLNTERNPVKSAVILKVGRSPA